MKKYKPTTPSQRQMSSPSYGEHITTDSPHKPLTKGRQRAKGRNHHGRITTRHRGGGAKRRYRDVDFKQDKYGVPARVETIEYDPNRSAFIALVVYKDGERRYVLATQKMKVGDEILTSEDAPIENGNRVPLSRVPVGYFVHNVELLPKQGGKMVRSAGSGAQVLAQEGNNTHLKMPSGEVRMVLSGCWASLGEVSNSEHNLTNVGKAGRKRHMGRRPVVRGSAMNPVDHKYGGGEGRTQRGTRRPKDIWGNVTGGRKTRKKKKSSNKMIIKRRKNKRKKK